MFLLIHGGRYGTIENESGKSYINLEYEYAIELGKPYFSNVISEESLDKKVRKLGKGVLEQENFSKYEEFKKLVTSKIVRFWDDPKDIKLSIHETLSKFSQRKDLSGWIKGDKHVNTSEISEELTRLSKENGMLRQQK